VTAFSALLQWPDSPAFEHSAEELALRVPLPGAEIVARKASGCEVAVARRPRNAVNRGAIFVDARKHWLCVGDVRVLDPPQPNAPRDGSDLERVVRIFGEQGLAGISKIHGEFSLVILNWQQRTAQALRDQLGARPLYFRELPQGMAFASDLRQLLAFGPPAEEPLDAEMVSDYLRDDFSHRGRTFFSNIRQVVPGHSLEVTRGRVLRQARYWFPEITPLSHLSYGDMIEEWRRRFRLAVVLRMDSDQPMASYLSGGMDSGSIVGVAHEAYVGSPHGRPPFFTLSALFPGTPYDETSLIADANQAAPSFHPLTWDGTPPNSLDLDSPLLAMPGLREGLARGPQTDLALMASHDIGTVFSGFGGDELGWSHGYFRDLISRGDLCRLAAEAMRFTSLRGWSRVLRADLRGLGARKPSAYRIPKWAGRRLRAAFEVSRGREDAALQFPSYSQSAKWSLVNLGRLEYATELTQLMLTDVGARLALPYRDLALTEFVLRIPWHLQAPGGDVRRVQRDAVAPYLSPAVRRIYKKTLFGGALQRQLGANEERIRARLHARRWVSEDFVLQDEARSAFESIRREDPAKARIRDWLPFWRIAIFDSWHDGILNYHEPGRMMMRDVTRGESVVPPDEDSGPTRLCYESPRMVAAGNVRDLLANVQGPSFDAAPGSDGFSPM
jgi:hypothetical protein